MKRQMTFAIAAIGLLVFSGLAFLTRQTAREPTSASSVMTDDDPALAVPDAASDTADHDAPVSANLHDAAATLEEVRLASRPSAARVSSQVDEQADDMTASAAVAAAATPNGDTVPRAWLLYSPFPDAYRLRSDHAVVWQGSSSARIEIVLPDSSQRSFGGALQTIRADAYRSRRVRFSAIVKTRGADAATIAIGADDQNGTQVTGKFMLVDERREFPVRGSSGWTPLTMVIDIPDTAVALNYGAFLLGGGVLWVDTARLETVDATTPLTNLPALRGPPHVSEPARIEGLAAVPMNMDFEDVEQVKR